MSDQPESLAEAEDVETWRRDFLEESREAAEADEALQRYRADLMMAAPSSLESWAASVVEETGVTSAGERFLEVPCPKLFAFGGKSLPDRTRAFVGEHDLPNLEFPESGHSPMVDEAPRFYAAIATFLKQAGAV